MSRLKQGIFRLLLVVAAGSCFLPPSWGSDCSKTSVAMTPLSDMGTALYKGYPGGLYPNGLNSPPAAYLEIGLTQSAAVQPLNLNGQPDPAGKVVLLSIGMSNTTMEFSAFKTIADLDPQKNPKVVIVDGAQGGQDAEIIKNPAAAFWVNIDTRLSQAGVNAKQVQAAWLKEAIAGENEVFPADALHLQNDLRQIVLIMAQRYPALQIIYFSSRTYAGYASTTLNPEPIAYQSGFAVDWLIQEKINAPANGPWLAWGPYIWTNGAAGRSDGLVWNCQDTAADGTHPSASGQQKVANLLLTFFKSDPTAVGWFTKSQAPLSSILIRVSGGGAGSAATSVNPAQVQAGYAVVGGSTGNGLYGTAVFISTQNGVVLSEVGVPASPPTNRARIFVDFRTGVASKSDENEASTVTVKTGLALVNTTTGLAHFTLTLRDKNGGAVASGQGTLAAGFHLSKFLDQLGDLTSGFNLPPDFATRIQFGSLEIQSDQLLSLVALRETINQRGESLYTTTPIVDENSATSGAPIYLAHFVDGGGYKTAIALMNPSAQPMSGSFTFFNQNGNPLSVRNEFDGTTHSSFAYAIPPQGVFVFQSDGSPSGINGGWVKLNPDAGTFAPVSSGIFSDRNNSILVTESGVPSVVPTTHARVYVDGTGGHSTGLSFGNPNSSAAAINLQAFLVDGLTSAGIPRAMSIPPNGHFAAYANQFISGLPAGFTGVLDFSASLPVVALTLRSLTNARGDTVLTTFPVADFNQSAPSPLVFPQIAAGGGFQTQFILLNTSGVVNTTVNFFGDDGTPLAVGKRQ
jgi:hypothetical protein